MADQLTLFKLFVPQWAKKYRQRRWHQKALRTSWLSRPSTPTDNHVAVYWNSGEQPNRQQLIDILRREMHNNDSGGVLEYGSHVGINIKLLHDQLQNDRLPYYAVEPNLEAFSFLTSKLPFVQALNSEDEGFLAAVHFPKKQVRLSFVNSVFYCVSSRRAKAVIGKLVERSEIIVIGDAMENVNGRRTTFAADPPRYMHPYERWLKGFGITDCHKVVAVDPRPQLNGYLIARKKPELQSAPATMNRNSKQTIPIPI